MLAARAERRGNEGVTSGAECGVADLWGLFGKEATGGGVHYGTMAVMKVEGFAELVIVHLVPDASRDAVLGGALKL